MDERLASLRDYDGTPMFYEPGQHPATHQLRVHRDALLDHLQHGDNRHARIMLRRVTDQITTFEERESERKCEMLYRLGGGRHQ